VGEIAVITGTTHGIGRVTSRELARAGRTVVMLCRNLEAAERVRTEICAQIAGASVHIVPCNLASLTSVREAARVVRERFAPIDLLINNAGMVSTGHRLSEDGYELTFATNHLGPFLLTMLLLDGLAARARIVNLASRAHYKGRMDLEDITAPRARYNPVAAYARSKLANVMHTFALARRLATSPHTVNCLHPGVVASNLLPPWLRLLKPLLSPQILDVERGARTSLYLALSPEVASMNGLYFDEHQLPQRAAELAYEVPLQERLWQSSSRWASLPPEA
jgi:NAD(P)-dependent dehydrogenase (short-subunit alcohol dehydrogenase family)